MLVSFSSPPLPLCALVGGACAAAALLRRVWW
jgi:hypothetical protein